MIPQLAIFGLLTSFGIAATASYVAFEQSKKASIAEQREKEAQLAIANLAEMYDKRSKVQDAAILEKDKTNEILSTNLHRALYEIRAVKADSCFDNPVPAVVTTGLLNAIKETGRMSGDTRVSNTNSEASITCRDTTEWVRQYTTALEQCNNQLIAIRKIQLNN